MESPTSPVDFDDSRKRVCKACDRCRIKKSKCDGKKPCSRCRNDDAICVFGGRKKKTDRVHPKGYVEILERQQRQLIRGIRALYDRQLGNGVWNGPTSQKGHPPTHEILEHLGALDVIDSSDDEDLEEGNLFKESFHHLRENVISKDKASRGSRSSMDKTDFYKQQALLPNQRPADYFGKNRLGSISESESVPSLSPDLPTSRPSPSVSIDTQHWSATAWPSDMFSHESTSVEKAFASSNGLTICTDNDFESGPLQDGFDAYLIPPWEPDKDLREYEYTS